MARFPTLLAFVATGLSIGVFAACGGSEKASRPGLVRSGSGDGGAPDPGPSGCTAEREGCECPETGAEVDCKVIETFGDYTTCTIGVYTCGEDGLWGPCVGERTTTPL